MSPGLIDCDYYKTDEYVYNEFVDLSNVKDAQPTGYYARIPVYIIGPRDGHIILSVNSTLNRDKDFVYEFRTYLFHLFILYNWSFSHIQMTNFRN